MIITKSVKLEINRGNIPYYKKFDEYKSIKIGDIVDIDMKYLAKGNNSRIKYICDICGVEKETSYKSYCDPRRNKEKDVCKSSCANEKRENTNIELYGVKNCFQNEEMKETAKETMLERYGVDHNMKTEKCKSDRKETYIKNWGFDNPTKNRQIFKKALNSGKRIKYFNNTEIYYQGTYELDFLEKFYDKIEIINGLSIQYKFNNEEKIYHSDFFIPNRNLIVEIKSTYWYECQKDMNIAKMTHTKEKYNFILILDKQYEEFINYITN